MELPAFNHATQPEPSDTVRLPMQPSIAPDVRYALFELMEQEVEVNPRLCHDQAQYLLGLAFKDPIEAERLMNRFTRPGGFDGENSWKS